MEPLNAALSNVDWEALRAATWAFANQPIVCALLPTTIGIILAQRVNLVVQQNVASIDAIRATASARDQLGDESEPDANDAPPSIGSPSTPARAPLSDEDKRRWDAGTALIKSIKDHVERTAAAVGDGRRRRKYNNIPRYDYRVLVLALAEDGALSTEDAAQLNHAFALWRRFRVRRSPVPEFVVTELRSIAKQFGGHRDQVR